MTAEQYATDLVRVLLVTRNDALPVAKLVLQRLAAMDGLAQCAVCGLEFEKHRPQQRYCSVKCRERYQYVTYKQGRPRP